MASVKFGAIVPYGVGKLGGHVFQRNAHGFSIRTNYSSTGNHFFADTETQILFAAANERWRNLPAMDKQEFSTLGAKYPVPDWDGDNQYLTGKQFHDKATIQAMAGGFLTPVDPYTYSNYKPLVECNRVIIRMGTTVVSLRYFEGFTNIDLQVFAIDRSVAEYNKTKPKLQFIGSIGAGLFGSVPVYDMLETIFGTITTGRNFTFKVGTTTSSGVSSYSPPLAGEYN